MKQVRILERTKVDGSIEYAIQQKHFLFRWWWVDAWMNSFCPYVESTFYTLERAKENLCYYDGSKEKVKVIYEVKT